MKGGIFGTLFSEENLDSEFWDFERDIIDVSFFEKLNEMMYKFNKFIVYFANSTAATRFLSLKLACSRLPYLYFQLDDTWQLETNFLYKFI
jgi:hypothetical protein